MVAEIVTAEEQTAAQPAPDAGTNTRTRKQTSFSGDVLKLVSGTTVAQGIGVLVTPLLTRMYGPEAFGTLALFTSITGIIGVVACLRYELAIMLPESDEEAADLLAVSLLSVVAVTLLTVPLVTWGRPLLLRLLSAPQLDPYLWLVPPVVFSGGVFQALNYWHSRTKEFGRLSVARVVSSSSTHLAKLGAGLAGYATAGALIWAMLLGSVLSTGMLAGSAGKRRASTPRPRFGLVRVVHCATNYRRFPLIDVWSALANTISWQLPALVLNRFFVASVIGYYSMGLRVLQLPMSLVGSAVAQVFFQRAAEAHVTGALAEAYENTIRRLLAIGVFPVLALAITGRSVFALVFGAEWTEAGVYAQILAPWILFWFISSPISTIFSILQMQDLLFRLNLVILVSRLVSLMLGGLLGNARLALAFFAGSGVLAYGYLVYAAGHAAGCSLSTLRSVSSVPVGSYVALLLLLALTVSGLPHIAVAVAGLLSTVLHFAYIAWREARFRGRLGSAGFIA